MSDIVERLRNPPNLTLAALVFQMEDAADEIERLRMHVDMQNEFFKANEELGLEVCRLRAYVEMVDRYFDAEGWDSVALLQARRKLMGD